MLAVVHKPGIFNFDQGWIRGRIGRKFDPAVLIVGVIKCRSSKSAVIINSMINAGVTPKINLKRTVLPSDPFSSISQAIQ